MQLTDLDLPEIRQAIASDPDLVRDALRDLHAEDIAGLFAALEEGDDATALLRCLPERLSVEVFERLGLDLQVRLLRELDHEDLQKLLTQMAPDDRADLFQYLPSDEAERTLEKLAEVDAEIAGQIRSLLLWQEDSAGGLMTTQYISLPPGTKVWESMNAVRTASRDRDTETIYYIYVCAYGKRLVGVVSLRDLILADPGETLEDIMTEQVVWVSPRDDQEKVANTIAKYDLSALPVVDRHGRMLGVVTVDDLVDVVIEEATEDAHKIGGVVPLEDSYFATGYFEFVWKRAAWLVVLFFGQILTTNVMQRHEDTLRLVIDLLIFIPLIISSGGNAGSQSASLVIRALAVGEIVPKDWWRVLSRELWIGLSLGLLLGVIGFARATIMDVHVDPVRLGAVVGISIVAVVVLGAVVGSFMPLLIRRLGFDPAVSSTPFIASLVDVLGLLVYFSVAQLCLRALIQAG